MHKLFSSFTENKLLKNVLVLSAFVSIHYSLTLYINSSFLSQFFSQTQVSSLYIIGSIISIYAILNISKIAGKIGLYRFVLYSIIIEFLSVLGMTVSVNATFIGICFLVYLINIALLFLSIDILIQDFAKDSSKTGGVRGIYLTIQNVTTLVSPAIVAVLLIKNIYAYPYLLSTLVLVPAYYFMRKLKGVNLEQIEFSKPKETLIEYIKNKDLFGIFVSEFLLWFFYAFMIIYTPIYMNKYIGFSWSEIGVIFTIMLVAFILFEPILGELEDDRYGEKEFLTIGFVIMGLSTLFISFITAKNFWAWTVVLFITRIGASFVEISSDTYFFKKADGKKTNEISFFRMTHPLSFVIAPLITTILLQFIPFQYTFIVIGSIMIIGTRYSLSLTDTN